MKRFFPALFIFIFCLSVRAELNVEWVDDNTIIVTGYGYGDTTNETALGSCTNCTAITPAELTAGMDVIISNVNNIQTFTLDILGAANFYLERVNFMQDDISSFQRWQSPYSTSSAVTSSIFSDFTNYIYGVDNVQTQLGRSFSSGTSPNFRLGRISYNDGIYDYATSVVSPELSAMENSLVVITNESERIMHESEVIKTTASSFRNLPSCQSCGGGTNTCSSCPCEEQWQTLLDYVRHIDDDQHDRYKQLHQISNNVFNLDKQFDSYAKLVSGVLYNDATIVVDDGQNSWSNVYRRGHSDLYDYDKSNILQRIELLLFGVTYNTSTNWGNVADLDVLDSDKSDIEDKFDDIKTSIDDGYDSLDSDVKDLRDSLRGFFDALNFFGSGQLGEFSLTDPFTVFGVYDFEIDSGGNVHDFQQLQRISRTAFQIVYWTVGVVFMLVFWFGFIRFVARLVLTVIKYLNNVLT